jgi:hypothetical protein
MLHRLFRVVLYKTRYTLFRGCYIFCIIGNTHIFISRKKNYKIPLYKTLYFSQMTTLQQIYEKADAYAVSRMFYSLLRSDGEGDIFPQSSVNRPHYEESEIPELSKCYPDGLRHILHNLVLDDPVQRMSERRAMLW